MGSRIFQTGDAVQLPATPTEGTRYGVVVDYSGPATVMVRLDEEYRWEDDPDGILEVTEDELNHVV
jgi:hypothetical protein